MSKISNPTSTPNALTEKELESCIKRVLVPITHEFIKNNKGKEFTGESTEKFYQNLDASLSKDPRIRDKMDLSVNQDLVRKDLARETAKELNKESKLSNSEKLIQGFGSFCEKIGLKKVSEACFKHVKEATLAKSVDEIAKSIASTKMSASVGDSASARIAKPINQEGRSR